MTLRMLYRGLVQIISAKINVIVVLRIYPLPSTIISHELRKAAPDTFAIEKLGITSRTQPPSAKHHSDAENSMDKPP